MIPCVRGHLKANVESILPKGPYVPCVSIAGRALLAGYHRYHSNYRKMKDCKTLDHLQQIIKIWLETDFWTTSFSSGMYMCTFPRILLSLDVTTLMCMKWKSLGIVPPAPGGTDSIVCLSYQEEWKWSQVMSKGVKYITTPLIRCGHCRVHMSEYICPRLHSESFCLWWSMMIMWSASCTPHWTYQQSSI